MKKLFFIIIFFTIYIPLVSMEITSFSKDIYQQIVLQLPTLSSTISFINTCKNIRQIIFNDTNDYNDYMKQLVIFISPKVQQDFVFINVFHSDLYIKLEEHFSVINKPLANQIATVYKNFNELLSQENPFHNVINKDSIEEMKLLLKHPTIDINKQDKDGNTPLHKIILKKNKEALQLLLKHPNINYNIKNIDEKTPLQLTLYYWKDNEIVDLLNKLSKAI